MKKPDAQHLLSQLKEAEELLRFPGVQGHLERGTRLLVSISRSAPRGEIANLAMRAVSEASSLRPSDLPLKPSDSKLHELLRRLRAGLQKAVR